MTMSAAASNRTNSDVAADNVNNKSESARDSDSNASEPSEKSNFNSNNGNELADEESSSPTICVYGSNSVAGPFDLDISENNEDRQHESYCECNVSSCSGIPLHLSVHGWAAVAVHCTLFDILIDNNKWRW